MPKCIHSVRNHPFTMCGVNLEEKKGALATEDPDSVTCQNCLKLLLGGSMGVPLSQIKGGAERVAAKPTPAPILVSSPIFNQRKALIRNKFNDVNKIRYKIKMMLMDVRVALGDIFSDEELSNLMELTHYLEAAEERATWCLDQIKEVWTDEGWEDSNGSIG